LAKRQEANDLGEATNCEEIEIELSTHEKKAPQKQRQSEEAFFKLEKEDHC
jgi:hypothetical protein